MTSYSAIHRISGAKLYILRRAPYFGPLVQCLQPREREDLPTMSVSARGVMYYNPNWVKTLSFDELAGVVCHEAMHLLRRHTARTAVILGRVESKLREIRAAATDKQVVIRDGDLLPAARLCNIGWDMEINDDLAEMGLALPGRPCRAADIDMEDGLPGEAYITALLRRMLDNVDQGQKPQQGMDFDDAPGAGSCGGVAGNPGDVERDEIEAAAAAADSEDGDPLDGMANALGDDLDGLPESVLEDRREAVMGKIKEAARKSRSSVPAGLQRLLDEWDHEPVVPWQDILTHEVQQGCDIRRGDTDYSYMVPSRQQGSLGYGPGNPLLVGTFEPVPVVHVLLDASGSMGQDEFNEFAGELDALLDELETPVRFSTFDTVSYDVDSPVESVSQALSQVRGGGGTDMRPALRSALERAPDVVVVVTDGYGPAPDVVETPTIWLLVGHNARIPYDSHGNDVDYGIVVRAHPE